MRAAVHESYKFPAGVLALAVHGVFFTLLYFGFTWQSQKPAAMNVELWQSLPEQIIEPAPAPQPVAAPVPKPVTPVEVVKPVIVMPVKKPVPVVEKKLPEVKPPLVKTPPVAETKKPPVQPQAKPAEPSFADQQAARELAEQAALLGKTVDEYTAKIITKIRRNIVMPPDVPNDASVEFSVTLLPGGSVLSARRAQSSGNAAYEAAVERAILKSQPLPLPPDPGLFNRFRELKLKFKPVE